MDLKGVIKVQRGGVFQRRLRGLRKKMGLTQEDLGRLVMVSVKTIQRWEDGTRSPRADELTRLAVVLNVPEIAFFEGANEGIKEFKLILDKEGECSLDMVNMSATAPDAKVMVVSGDRIAIQTNLKTVGMTKDAAYKAMIETFNETFEDAWAQQEKWRERKSQG